MRLALSQEFVKNAVQLLVTRFMPLNPTDLENWIADPEEWVNLEDKENDQWEFEIRVSLFVNPKFTSWTFPLALQRKGLDAIVQSISAICYTIAGIDV